MPVFKWRRRPTAFFGRYWIPLVTIKLESTTGQFQPVSLQVDSGAVVSLLPRSMSDLLGISIFAGRRIELRSVGGALTIAYVHSIRAKFSDEPSTAIRVAIADSEHVPSLLGRLDVFDRFQIAFDPAFKQTVVTAIV